MNPKFLALVLLTACNPDGSFGDASLADGKGPPEGPECTSLIGGDAFTSFANVSAISNAMGPGKSRDLAGRVTSMETSMGGHCYQGKIFTDFSATDEFKAQIDQVVFNDNVRMWWNDSNKEQEHRCWANFESFGVNCETQFGLAPGQGNAQDYIDEYYGAGHMNVAPFGFQSTMQPGATWEGCVRDPNTGDPYVPDVSGQIFHAGDFLAVTTWFVVQAENPNNRSDLPYASNYYNYLPYQAFTRNPNTVLATIIDGTSNAYSQSVTSIQDFTIGQPVDLCFTEYVELPSTWAEHGWKYVRGNVNDLENAAISADQNTVKFKYQCDEFNYACI